MLFKNILKFSIRSKKNLKFNLAHTQFSSTNSVFKPKIMPDEIQGVPLQQLIDKFSELAPSSLAENWDNTGLLIETNRNALIKRILLTIDLTEAVVEEAKVKNADLIISYHPNIFKPIKKISQDFWKDRIIVSCIQSNISVYSPHTRWDAMKNGVNDWLVSFLNSKTIRPIIENGQDNTIGMGRYVTLESPITFKNIIEQCKQHVGIPSVRIAIGKHNNLESKISTVAVCAGSGAQLFHGVEADLYLTGEMSHHEVLDAVQNNVNVILCGHSHSERGFLKEFVKRCKDNEEKFVCFTSDSDQDPHVYF